MQMAQKRSLATRFCSSENSYYAEILCLRSQQLYFAHRGVQACNSQTIVGAMELQLNIWVYTDNIEKRCDGP